MVEVFNIPLLVSDASPRLKIHKDLGSMNYITINLKKVGERGFFKGKVKNDWKNTTKEQ